MSEIHGLFSHLHLAVKSALLRQVSYLLDIVLGNRTAIEQYLAFVRDGNTVDDTDKSRLTRTVRSEQTEDLSFRDVHRNMVKSDLLTEALADIFTLNKSHFILHV